MIVMLFPEPRERGKAIAAFSFTGSAGASIGQVLGGVLTEALNWHWIFLINLPIGTATVVLALRVLDSDRPGGGGRPDLLGAVLATAGLMLGVYTIVETSRNGWVSASTLTLAVIAVALLTGFAIRQARIADPLLPLRIFRSRNVSGANLGQVLAISAMFGFQVMAALYMQQVLGYGAAATGLAMLPAALAIGVVSLGLSARLGARFGERRMLIVGLAMLIAALGYLTRVPVHAHYVTDMLPAMILIGGGGLVLPALASLGMSAAGPRDAGVVGGVFNTAQQVGGALGVAVLSTLAASRSGAHPTPGALTDGFHLAFQTSTALLVAAALVALVVLRSGPAATAEAAVEPAADAAAVHV
jgi:MFS family permease